MELTADEVEFLISYVDSQIGKNYADIRDSDSLYRATYLHKRSQLEVLHKKLIDGLTKEQ